MPVKINGSTSGSVTLAAPATGSDVTLTLPTTALATQAYADSAADAAETAAIAGGGLVLVSPTSTANSGGTISVSGGTTTFTGVSNFSLNGVFSSTYRIYRVLILYVTTNADEDLFLRLRVAGSDSSSNYENQFLLASNTTVTAARSTGDSVYKFMGGASTAKKNAVTCDIFGPAEADTTSFVGNSFSTVGGARIEIRSGRHTTETAYDGFSVFPQNAGSTLTGTISVFGYKK